jgi:hypothetical protein
MKRLILSLIVLSCVALSSCTEDDIDVKSAPINPIANKTFIVEQLPRTIAFTNDTAYLAQRYVVDSVETMGLIVYKYWLANDSMFLHSMYSVLNGDTSDNTSIRNIISGKFRYTNDTIYFRGTYFAHLAK